MFVIQIVFYLFSKVTGDKNKFVRIHVIEHVDYMSEDWFAGNVYQGLWCAKCMGPQACPQAR